MNGSTSLCVLCDSTPEDVSGMKIYNNCTLSSGEVCSVCKDYIALETRISATKQVLSDLLSQRQKLRTQVNQNHDLLTTRVPLEIVRSVFQFCVPAKRDFNDFYDTNLHKRRSRKVPGPLFLGTICRSWRDIAWATQPLWTMLSIDFNRLKSLRNVSLTRDWLDRAGQLPLSIRMASTHFRATEQESEIATQLLAVVNGKSKQWEYLDIVGFCWWIGQVEGALGGAPNLQALRISGPFNEDYAFMDSTPRPSQLSLHNCPLNTIQVEWDHLTHVHLSELFLNDCIELLRRAPNLVYCKFYCVYERQHQLPIHDVPIVYQTLESLEFDCYTHWSIQFQPNHDQALAVIAFFRRFVFPNLKHLKLKLSGGNHVDRSNRLSWDSLATHIKNSSPPLISLGIWQRPGPHSMSVYVNPILHWTPLLRDLTMLGPFEDEWDGENNPFFKFLANTSLVQDDSTQTNVNFLPNLQSIKFILGPEQNSGKFWKAIPTIFGNIDEPHTRPLKTLRVRAEMKPSVTESDCLAIESKEAVLRLLRLRDQGFILDLKNTDENIDILEQSMTRHGLHNWPEGEPQHFLVY